MVTVVNRHKSKEVGVYVGRGAPLGNQFVIGKDGTRAEVIELFRVWLREQWRRGGAAKQMLLELAQKHARGETVVLICSCKPLACHADVIADAIVAVAAQLSAK